MREWLKKYRVNKGFTQEKIAELIGVDTTTYGKYELGVRRPSVERAKAIAKLLGFDWTLFFGEEKTSA